MFSVGFGQRIQIQAGFLYNLFLPPTLAYMLLSESQSMPVKPVGSNPHAILALSPKL